MPEVVLLVVFVGFLPVVSVGLEFITKYTSVGDRSFSSGRSCASIPPWRQSPNVNPSLNQNVERNRTSSLSFLLLPTHDDVPCPWSNVVCVYSPCPSQSSALLAPPPGLGRARLFSTLIITSSPLRLRRLSKETRV